jgi:O-acetylserine/cysteine efflux transporter
VSEAQPHQPFGAADIFAVIVMNVMWGLNLVAVKMGVDLVQPMTAAWLRQAMVLLICLPALRIVPGRMRELTGLGLLSGSLFYILVNWSLAVSDKRPRTRHCRATRRALLAHPCRSGAGRTHP